MKRIVVYLLIIVLFTGALSGCSLNSAEKNSKPNPVESSEIFNLYYPLIGSFIPTEDHVKMWETFMRDKHKFKIDLNYLPLTSKLPAVIDIKELKEVSEGSGFVYIKRYEDLTELIKNGVIAPIEYCVDSLLQSYEKINPDSFEGFTDSMREVWAFPLMVDNLSISKRTYNKEWLDKSGMSVPENIEEFFEYAKYVAYEDPDGNGIDDTYILEYAHNQILYSLTDIFRAFGCYPDRLNPTAYNPLSQSFENLVFSENFIEAMEFIKLLSDEGLIVQSDENNYNTKQSSYKVASAYNSTLPYNYVNERTYGYYLQGPNESMLIEERLPEYCIVALKNTSDVLEKIDDFYKMIFSSPESSIDLLIGIEGKDYVDQGSYFEVMYDPWEGDDNSIIRIYSDFQMDTFDYKPMIQYNNEMSVSRVKELRALNKEKGEADLGVTEYLGTKMSYKIDFNTFNYEVYELTLSKGRLDKLFTDILELNIPIEDATADYRTYFLRLGIIEKLDEINHR